MKKNEREQSKSVTFASWRADRGMPSAVRGVDALGMRPMQARLYKKRGAQHLLLKAPPAAGKSRALMFTALDKLKYQGLKKALVIVPERSIGGSFQNEDLKSGGFHSDWEIAENHDLCARSGSETSEGTVKTLRDFLASPVGEGGKFTSRGRALVCCHATFRRVYEALGPEAFDGCFLAVDEFHHVSSGEKDRQEPNILGKQIHALMERNKTHIMAMTGSFFRGDGQAVLNPEDGARFETITYSYYEQLQSYRYLKNLDLGYYFYSGTWLEDLGKVINPARKTIIHIPNVNSRESSHLTKEQEVDAILEILGEHEGVDPATGFQLIRTAGGKLLKVADLVDDDPGRRDKVIAALRAPEIRRSRDYVDVIIALGMAKEGFDWVWAEDALTIGARSSLTEIVQIIGRVTRDASGKEGVRFLNMIAEPAASQQQAQEAVNELLKAVAVSLLMEQALVPKISFVPKTASSPPDGVDIDGDGNPRVHIKGLVDPETEEGRRIVREDLDGLTADLFNNPEFIQKGIAIETGADVTPQEITVEAVDKTIKAKYPELPEKEREAVRQHLLCSIRGAQAISRPPPSVPEPTPNSPKSAGGSGSMPEGSGGRDRVSGSIVEALKGWVLSTKDLDIDLLDRVNPFAGAYAILSKTLDEVSLRYVQDAVNAKKPSMSWEEAKDLIRRALGFKRTHGRLPEAGSADPWERHLAEAVRVIEKIIFQHRQKEDGKESLSPMSDLTPEELEELGIGSAPDAPERFTPLEERMIAGFEEIVAFRDRYGRNPSLDAAVSEQDADPVHTDYERFFGRLYAIRLENILRLILEFPRLKMFLSSRDKYGWLSQKPEMFEDHDPEGLAALLESAGDGPASENPLEKLKHVRPYRERLAEEEGEAPARRIPCTDFENFAPKFARLQQDLQNGSRVSMPFADENNIQAGQYFILDGQMLFIASKKNREGPDAMDGKGRQRADLRVIYDNKTEAPLQESTLRRELKRQKNNGRRIIYGCAGKPVPASPNELITGTVYVVCSLSQDPAITRWGENLLKIGVTTSSVRKRLASAYRDPTYLYAPVEVVQTYEIPPGISPEALEKLLHRILAPARADLEVRDGAGQIVRPREWFLVPRFVIDQIMEALNKGDAEGLRYNRTECCLEKVNERAWDDQVSVPLSD